MSNGSHGYDYLGTLSTMYASKGDSQTISAIHRELLSNELVDTLSQQESEWMQHQIEKAHIYSADGAHELAYEIYCEISSVCKQLLGPNNPLSLERMYDLANCLVKLGEFTKARKHYKMILQIEIQVYGSKNTHSYQTRKHIIECEKSLERANSLNSLQKYFQDTIKTSNPVEVFSLNTELDRIYRIASRYEFKNRHDKATIFFKMWISKCKITDEPKNELALKHIKHYAFGLCKIGKFDESRQLFAMIVSIYHKQHKLETDSRLLKEALQDYAHCLKMSGDSKSASATLILCSRFV